MFTTFEFNAIFLKYKSRRYPIVFLKNLTKKQGNERLDLALRLKAIIEIIQIK